MYFSAGITRLVAGILYWIILFIFVTAALNTAGLTGVSAWLERIVDFLPGIVTGGLIILLGYILAGLVRDVTLAAAHSAEFTEAVVISRLAQAITLVTALIIGLEQIGIDVSFLTTMLGISSAALLFGFALAFGLGARTLVSNLIAAHHLRDILEPGQTIRIRNWEGTVLEVSPTAVILDTEEGRTTIPAKLYQEEAVITLVGGHPIVSEPNLLSLVFLEKRPRAAAALLQDFTPEDCAQFLQDIPLEVLVPVIDGMASWPAARTLSLLPVDVTADVLRDLPDAESETLLRLMDSEQRNAVMAHMPAATAQGFANKLAYPISSVGAWMDTAVPALHPGQLG